MLHMENTSADQTIYKEASIRFSDPLVLKVLFVSVGLPIYTPFCSPAMAPNRVYGEQTIENELGQCGLLLRTYIHVSLST